MYYSSTQAKSWRQRHSIVRCECGGTYHVNNKARHIKKSKIHEYYTNGTDNTEELVINLNNLLLSETSETETLISD